MTGVIALTGKVLDDLGHPRGGPNVIGKAVRHRSFEQSPLYVLELFERESSSTTAPANDRQRLRPALRPPFIPTRSCLSRHFQLLSDIGLARAPIEHPARSLATLRQALHVRQRWSARARRARPRRWGSHIEMIAQ